MKENDLAGTLIRSDIAEAIYEAAVDGTGWDRPAHLLMEACGGIQGLAISYSAQSHDILGRAGHVDQKIFDACMTVHHVNPWATAMTAVAPGQAAVIDEHIAFDELRRTAFFADVLQPLGIAHAAALMLSSEDGGWFSIGMARHRRAGPFSRRQADALQAYGQLTRRATALTRRSEGLARIRRAELGALDLIGTATVLVDEVGRVVLANRAAEALEAQGALTLRDTPLCVDLQAAAAFRLSVMTAAGGATPAPLGFRDAAGMPLILMAAPLGTTVADRLAGTGPRGRVAAALFVFSSAPGNGPSTPMLQALFGLTPAEARVAAEIALGDGERDAARRLGIGLNSVKTHRQRIFLKLGITRRSELVRLLARLPFSP